MYFTYKLLLYIIHITNPTHIAQITQHSNYSHYSPFVNLNKLERGVALSVLAENIFVFY